MSHVELPTVTEPIVDLQVALSLLSYPCESDGIADRDFFPNFTNHFHTISIVTCATSTERSRERTYIVSEELARILVDEGYVRDDSLPGILELYSISDKGELELATLEK